MPSLRTVRNTILPPVVLLLAIVLVWHLAVQASGIKPYLLPSPLAVIQAAWSKKMQLVAAFGLTGAAALCGFTASVVVGSTVAAIFAISRFARASAYPYAIFLQTVPIVAIAPLIVVWSGYGFRSVVIVSFIISLFPIITNVTTGMTNVDRDLLDLFALQNATPWQVLFKLRLPSAVPYLVTGAKVSGGMAVVGAIVGEFFTGMGSTRAGLGFLIWQSAELTNTASLFAAVIGSTALGMLVFAAVNVAGTTILSRWYHA